MNARAICCVAAMMGLLLGCTGQSAARVPEVVLSPSPTPFEQVIAMTVAPKASATPTPESTPTPEPTAAPTSTPEPTAAPTSTPEPTATPEPTPEPITQEMLDSGMFDAFYDETVFVGDSLTLQFKNYIRAERAKQEGVLGTAQFLGAVGMNASFASTNRANPEGVTFTYRGNACTLTYALRAMEAKRAVILLGINDIFRNRETVKESFRTLVGVIQTYCPDTEIVILGFLPVRDRYCREHSIDIDEWNAFSNEVGEIVQSCGATFLSFASELMDENGYLDLRYSSDNNYHLNEEGNAVWLNFLRRYAASQMHPGAEILTEPAA